jgi:CHAT domain-containing protein
MAKKRPNKPLTTHGNPFSGREIIDVADTVASLKWSAGPGAQVEVVGSEVPYKVGYTLAWRRTIRAPMQNSQLDRLGYADLVDRLLELKKILNEGDIGRFGKSINQPKRTEQEFEELNARADNELESLGRALYNRILPTGMRQSLQLQGARELFFEIGVDESLNEFPVELIFDELDYYCLKHNIGRYVVKEEEIPMPDFSTGRERSLLLISVPCPDYVKKSGNDEILRIYPKLDHAVAEAETIEATLRPILKERLKYLPNASYRDFDKATAGRGTQYDIVHFCGHADFDEKDAENSALIFKDRAMGIGDIREVFRNVRPLFCFINACQSLAASDPNFNFDPKAKGRFYLYGLGKAFLQTGAYLLGSRSLLDDKAAAAFAKAFYENLLGEQKKPLGEAVRLARIKCKEAARTFDWASYILYGDPRVTF